ncbi:MAG: TatD family hydrolase [Clostridia bacterium]|nr:TatD family hydrolase [Clostridia bacterium]
MLIFDSHAHYFDRRFLTDAEGATADELLPTILAPAGEVSHIVNVGTNVESSGQAIEQAARYVGMFAAVGIHPEDCQQIEGEPEEQLAALRELLGDEQTRKRDKIVALGEIGLDYYERDYLPVNKPLQAWYFEQQLALAEQLGLPVIIHDREAHGDCFETVLRHPDVRGVFHSFSGSAEMARELVRRGWYISFSGVVTFKNARRVGEVAASVPLDRLLVETDAPYLAPHPHRGRRNDSSLMRHTVEALATLRGVTSERMAEITAQNAASLFGIAVE